MEMSLTLQFSQNDIHQFGFERKKFDSELQIFIQEVFVTSMGDERV